MKPWAEQGAVRLYHGDTRTVMQTLPAESVHCVVTSPPYWSLRDYGVDGQIGLEETPDAFIAALVDVFQDVRRVLRKDGTVWLNLGDSYANNGTPPPFGASGSSGLNGAGSPKYQATLDAGTGTGRSKVGNGLKPKDLVGMPWRVALALQADGWWLRSCIIWAKPAPMPESVTDRPTTAHEYVFLLSKAPTYYYDATAVREPHVSKSGSGNGYARPEQISRSGRGQDGAWKPEDYPGGRNLRTVWTINSEPCSDAHFATFPQALVEPCVKAGTSEYGCCSTCGAPWTRQTESELVKSPKHGKGSVMRGRGEGTDVNGWAGEAMPRLNRQVTTTGWAASCSCNAAVVPCVVLDPFAGSGTTCLVARRLGRRSIGIDLSEEYLRIALKRLSMPDPETGLVSARSVGEGQSALAFDV